MAGSRGSQRRRIVSPAPAVAQAGKPRRQPQTPPQTPRGSRPPPAVPPAAEPRPQRRREGPAARLQLELGPPGLHRGLGDDVLLAILSFLPDAADLARLACCSRGLRAQLACSVVLRSLQQARAFQRTFVDGLRPRAQLLDACDPDVPAAVATDAVELPFYRDERDPVAELIAVSAGGMDALLVRTQGGLCTVFDAARPARRGLLVSGDVVLALHGGGAEGKALYLSMRVENRLRCCVFSSLQLCSYATRKVEQLSSAVAFGGQDFNHPGFAEFDPAQSVALTHVPENDTYTVWAMEGCVERFCLSEQSIADVKICRDVALVVHDYGEEQAAALTGSDDSSITLQLHDLNSGRCLRTHTLRTKAARALVLLEVVSSRLFFQQEGEAVQIADLSGDVVSTVSVPDFPTPDSVFELCADTGLVSIREQTVAVWNLREWALRAKRQREGG